MSVVAHTRLFTGPGLLVVALVVVSLAYVGAFLGHPPRGRAHAPPRAPLAFAAGVTALVVALAGPVEDLAHHAFSVHMLQHVLLAVIAPPLLLLGRPLKVLSVWSSRSAQRRNARAYGRMLRLGHLWPVAAPLSLTVYAGVWWLWHVPAMYTAAVESAPVHAVEHASLVGAAVLLWAPIVRPRRQPAWLAPLLLLGAAIQGGILATLITFAPRAWYGALFDPEGAPVLIGQMSALEDQQLAGALMWVLAGMVYLFAAAVSFIRWLSDDDTRSQRMLAARTRQEISA